MKINKKTIVRISENLTEKDLGDEVVVMRNLENEFHTFKDTAYDIWKKAHESVSAGDLLKFVINEYEIEEETAWNDLVNFLVDCKKKELIR